MSIHVQHVHVHTVKTTSCKPTGGRFIKCTYHLQHTVHTYRAHLFFSVIETQVDAGEFRPADAPERFFIRFGLQLLTSGFCTPHLMFWFVCGALAHQSTSSRHIIAPALGSPYRAWERVQLTGLLGPEMCLSRHTKQQDPFSHRMSRTLVGDR
jgi:hypothetical protein